MALTIRHFLIRRSRQYRFRAGVFLMGSGIILSMATRSFVLRFACAVIVAVVVLAAFVSLSQIPCPKCRKSLGMVGFKVANSGPGSWSRPAHCPHCGVSFDETMT
jgi:hypothetical protein